MLAVMTAQARADVLEVKDLDGFETCLQLDELLVTVKTATGSQTRLLGNPEIQPRCIASAVQLLAGTKDQHTVLSFVDAVKRLSAPGNALELVDLVVRRSPAACNDTEVYDVLTSALERPDELAGNAIVRARPVVARCLKDKAFRKDFLEEIDSSNRHLAAHACDILRQEKLVTSCKGSKP